MAGRWLANFLTLLMFWVVFSYTDLFGLEGVLKERSQEIIDRFMAPFYPATYEARSFVPKNAGRMNIRAQDKIAVVLITDETAKTLNTYNPLPFTEHARILKEIMLQEPAAVFIDLDFQSERKDDHFKDLILPFRDDFPVLFAGGRSEDLAHMPLPLRSRGTVVAWDGEAQQYPLLLPGANAISPDTPTAAMSLFQKLCLQHGETPRRWPGCPAELDLRPSSYQETLALRWGATVPRRQQVVWSTEKCPLSANPSPWQRVKVAVMSVLPAVFAGFAGQIERRFGDRNPCFYHLTIPAERLAAPQILDAIEQEERDLGDEAPPLLKGRVVFYGAMITGVHDFIHSPAHGRVPGVFAHAMAFDNLLTLGAEYYKGDEPENSSPLFNVVFSDELLLWMLISGGLAYRYARTGGPDLPTALVAWIAGGIARAGGTLWLVVRFLCSLPRRMVALAYHVVSYLRSLWARIADPAVIGPRRILIIFRLRGLSHAQRASPATALTADPLKALVERFVRGDLMLFALILLMVFFLNEFLLRREVADWISLALLYFLVTHVVEVADDK